MVAIPDVYEGLGLLFSVHRKASMDASWVRMGVSTASSSLVNTAITLTIAVERYFETK